MQDYAPLSPPYRVFVLDDHKLVTELLAQRLATDTAIRVVGSGNTGNAAFEFLAQHRVDVLLLDMELGGEDGIGLARSLLQREPGLRILGLSGYVDSHYPLALLEAGGRGFLSKRTTTRELVDSVRRVARGDLAVGADVAWHLATAVRDAGPMHRLRGLTHKESEVLRLLSLGHNADEISEALAISIKTVQSHRHNLRRKLNLKSDVEMCLLALKAGLVRVHEAK